MPARVLAATLVASQLPPIPGLEHGDVDPGRGKREKCGDGDGLEKRQILFLGQ